MNLIKKFSIVLLLSVLFINRSNGLSLIPPNLIQPYNNSIDEDVSLTFWWSSVTNATQYNIRISYDSLFTTGGYDSYSTTDHYSVIQLNYGYTYYWKVRALNATDTSTWSTTWNFATKSAVTLFSPPDNGPPVALFPTLNWNQISGTNWYHLELDSTPLFNSTIKLVDSTMGGYYPISFPMLFGADYYWRVKASNYNSISNWSSVFHFTTVNQMTLQNPSDGAANQNPLVYFNWASTGNGCNYEYQIDTTPQFNSPGLFDTVTFSNSIARPKLYFGKTYYWHVRAETGIDTLPWTPAWSFTVTDQLILSSPANGSININPCSISYNWASINGVSQYRFETDTTSLFNSGIKYDTLVPYELGYNHPNFIKRYMQNYYWRVIGYHTLDSVISNVFQFTTTDKGNLGNPPDSAINVSYSSPILISWFGICGDTILFQFDEDSLFGSPLTGVTSTTQAPVTLLAGTHYFWRLKFIMQGDTSEWTGVHCFTTGLQPSPVPLLLYPQNGAYGVPPPALLKWQNVGAAYDYRVKVDTSSAFLNPMIFTAPDTFYYAPVLLNHIYYWEVQAHDSSGYCDWSFYKQFSTWNVGINEINSIPEITVYPNPFNDEILIGEINGNSEIILSDLSGKEVIKQKSNGSEVRIDTKYLQPGFYLLRYREQNKWVNFKVAKLLSPR